MAIYKGFTVSIHVGDVDVPFASCVLSVLQSNGGSISRTANPTSNVLSGATDEYASARGALFCVGNSFNEFMTDVVSQLPLAEKINIPLPIPSNAEFRFTNSSGAYMETSIRANSQATGFASLYDVNGVWLGTSNSIQLYYNTLEDKEIGQPKISPPVIVGNIVDGVLESGRYSVMIWGNYRGYDKAMIVEVDRVDPITIQFINMLDDYDEHGDPYGPGGPTGTGGGQGTFSGTGDDIEIPSLPTLSATATGFITLFNPTAAQLNNLANYMWSNPLFDLDAWKKIFSDPMDAILGLSIVPVAVPNGGTSAVTVGNISTGVSMNKAGAQYVAVDCGTLKVEEYWGAYLDYDPFTKAEIYLPYIGTHPLSVDDIMGKSVHVVYHIDILSGACCAFVKCGSSVLYSFVGQCSCSIPITGNDWTNVINGTLTIAASIGTMVATGGASAPMSVGTIASTAVNSMKPNVEKSGSMGGMGGMLGVQTPYLILTRPRQAVPENQNKFLGYPSFITMLLGDCAGYTVIDSVHLENIAATEQELSEIENLLKGGVIF